MPPTTRATTATKEHICRWRATLHEPPHSRQPTPGRPRTNEGDELDQPTYKPDSLRRDDIFSCSCLRRKLPIGRFGRDVSLYCLLHTYAFKLAKKDKWKPFLRGILPFSTLVSVGYLLTQGFGFTSAMNNSSALFITNVILLLSIEIGLFSDRLYSKKDIKPSIVLAGSFIFLIVVICHF